jgi:hypothetical protein
MLRLLLLITISFSAHAQLKKTPHFSLQNVKGTATDFTPHGTQTLSFGITDAANCADCHQGSMSNDANYMPAATWSGSMMANATRDPLFWAAVDIANQDIPGVGDFCIRCHTPMAFYKGHTKDGTGDMDYANGCKLTGTVSQSIDTETNDYQGVNCHFCHRQEANGPNGEALITNNANAWIDDEVCDNPLLQFSFQPCRKGPYNDYNDSTGFAQPPHDWEYSSFIKKGEFCGSCHNVSSPEIEINGVLTIAKKLWDNGIETSVAMPIERTFAEWQNSLFSDLIYRDQFGGGVITSFPNLKTGQTCQTCHMPESMDADTRACIQTPPGRRVGDLKKHEFAGGNSWMPSVLKNAYGPALGQDRVNAFDQTIASSLNLLQNQSALVETSLISSTPTEAQVNVKVTNLTGHKLPTGDPEGRRMWINLTVKDASDTLIYESGAYNEVNAVLTYDSDIKIYETQQGIWDANTSTCVIESLGNKLFHFALNNCIAKDNRIPPLGFTGGNDLELKPVAIIYPTVIGDSSRLVNYDETNYSFVIPNGTAFPLSITAVLKYQTSSKDYIDFLNDESSTPSENTLCNRTQTTGPANQSRGAFMKTLWENNGKSAPVAMATSTITLTQ